ncbi:FAD-dependent 5-carboxymethylaminomethyl-2-thiouridine(34) oxidoreductase MnmC [Thiomicrospira microaerophila]|uniref:FAD-dependent 5-carboxymethylaminomethyl-2-thiouridine(34) oxidoreductase MnmC n=1 Tax=Thiomicrospira microaerophila TaxID=406020 RepID=UPI00200F404F|nr:FAD-dependent 5-carboxymethylaminomethyl-2-thiouridine(34) oxidoreductase MnmC [Thiomicrospira microaerophila]UQB42092.1 FAD-dependent 5-carboxymethylaminomethyl-2-thiouridine(34) oxidoreductase MnmC [Thiomicrospira microaerophila]
MQQTQWYKSRAPWFDTPSAFCTRDQLKGKQALVVGAGLAGAAVAHRLANLGLMVKVVDQGASMAQGASGNLAGALHPLVTADWNLRSQWYWQGLQATLAYLEPWLAKDEIKGELNGLLHLAVDEKNFQRMQQALIRVPTITRFAHWFDVKQASDKLGGECPYPGLFFPRAGWFNPPSIVARCLSHQNIQLELNQTITGIVRSDDQAWLVNVQDRAFKADIVVLASGAISSLNDQFDLAIRPVKGQVTQLEPSYQAWSLGCSVAHQGYSAPADKGYAVTGATFEAPDLTPDASKQADMKNLAMAQTCLPGWLAPLASQVDMETSGRVSFRPTTPDHLPIIGALPDVDWMRVNYLSQSSSHTPFRFPPQRYNSGLYVSNGHGARGLMSVFLAADIIAEQITGQDVSIDAKLLAACHPARFLIRAWQKTGNGKLIA